MGGFLLNHLSTATASTLHAEAPFILKSGAYKQ